MAGIKTFGMALAIGGLVCGMAITEPARAEGLTVGAAYSLKGAFEEILPMFENEYGTTVRVEYGSSQLLRRRVEQGECGGGHACAPCNIRLRTIHKFDSANITSNWLVFLASPR